MTRRRSEAGAILIETLVAVLILAALSGVWFETVGRTAAQQRALAVRTQAMLVAASRLATVGVVEAVVPGTTQGSDAGFAWEIVTEQRPGSDRLAEVTVTVRDARGRPLATLSTLRVAA